MATIKDVSELAGVSVATVSRALNNSGYVSEKSRRKVEQAVKALDFVPNEVARTLYHKKSKMVGLLVPDISNPYFTSLASGAEDALSNKGYGLLLGNVQDDMDKTIYYVRNFEQNNVAGILATSPNVTDLVHGTPVMNIDRISNDTNIGVHSDDYQGGVIAGQAIADRNPGNVVVMVGPKYLKIAQDRLAGTLFALDAREVTYQLFQTKSYRVEDAAETIDQLFSKYPQMTSIIATNDIYGALIIKEAFKRGIDVPNQLQVLGYDNSSFGGLVYPGLSTINQPAYDVGYIGATLLMKNMENQQIDKTIVKLPVNLVLRESLRERVEESYE